MLRLDIRQLARLGYIRPDIEAHFSWQWTRDGKPSGHVDIVGNWTSAQLTYGRKREGGEMERFSYPVALVHTPCTYGSSRPWWLCPRCGARRAVLYGLAADGRFGCRGRECMNLAYISEAQDACQRSWLATRRLVRRLKGSQERDMYAPPRRPKGMHRRTYERLCKEFWALDMQREDMLLGYGARIAAQHPEMREELRRMGMLAQ